MVGKTRINSRTWKSLDKEKILAIDITRGGFEEILLNSVLSKFEKNIYGNYEKWKKQLSKSDVRCQWDPDRDIYGNSLEKKAIQIGIKGEMVKKYISK